MLTKFQNLDAAIEHISEIQRLTKTGSWELDLVTNKLSWTDETYRILEIDPKAFGASYEAFLSAIHPEDRSKVDHAYTASVNSRAPYEISHRLLMPDGRVKIVRERGETFYGDGGEPLRSVGTVQDITAEMESKLALERAQEDLVQAEHLAQFGHYKLMAGEETFHWSESVYRILGKSPNSFQPTFENILNHIHPDDRIRQREQGSEVLAGHSNEPMTVRWLKDDGQAIHIESCFRPMTGPDGAVTGLFGTMQDVTRRVQAEARSVENAKRYEMVVDAVNDGIWDWDIAEGVIYVSPRWKAILGYMPDEQLEGLTDYFSLLHQDDLVRSREAVRACLEDGIPFAMEIRRCHKDGKYRWVKCRASAIYDANNSPIRMLGSMTDITVEKENLETKRLFEQSLGLQSAISEAPVSIAMFDTSMCYLSASNRWCEYLNCVGVDLVGQSFLELTDKAPDGWQEIFQRALTEGASQIDECLWTYKYDMSVWLKWILRAWSDANGEISGVVVYIENITSQKEAEIERFNRASLYEWMEKIANSIPGIIGTFKMDADGKASFPQLSKPALNVLGIPPEDLRASADPFFNGIVEEDALRVRESTIRSGNDLLPFHEEFRFNHPEKGVVWIEGRSIPEKCHDGSVVWHGFLQDISKRKLLEMEALRKTQLLHNAQKMELVGQLSAGIAHDFNNLLAVISGGMEFVSDWMRTGSLPDQKLIAAASNACQRGKELVQRLLNFSRQLPIKLDHAAIDPLILELLTILHRTLGKSIEIKTSLTARDATALIDRSQFTSAILNLALNSRDAMSSGGHLAIETWVQPSNNERLAGEAIDQRAEMICVKVADTGCGMTDDTRRHAFEPGFTTKPVGIGTGIGLSLVLSFVQQAGGHIDVESNVGRGTTITLFLPRSLRDPEPETIAADAGAASARSRRTILLVEDDLDVRAVVGAQLKKLNYDVRVATTGEEALEALLSPTDISFLLTDVILRGGIDGIEVVKEALRLRPRLGVICMSGYATPERHIERLRLQNIQLLEKPFSIGQLSEAMERLELDNF